MKRKILLLLCVLGLVIGSNGIVTVASAAQSTVKIKFNGKTINFKSKSEPKTLKDVEKKWGKKTRKEDETGAYVWEKGKTTLTVATTSSGKSLGHISASIGDKNASVAGVTVGMGKNDALKKLRDSYGKKSVLVTKKGQDWDFFGEDGYIALGAPLSDEDDCIYALRGHYHPIYFDLKDDKISYIYWGGIWAQKSLLLWM